MPEYHYYRKSARFGGKKYEATGKTEREAMMKLAEKLAAAKRGENTINGNMSVNAWFNQWLRLYKEPKGLTSKSLGMYEEKYQAYIKPRIGTMRLCDVKDVHLQEIMNEQAGKSISHIKKVRMVLQEMFRRARQSRLILYDPAELLELPAAAPSKRRPLSPTERAALEAVATTHPAGLWALTLLHTGMRPGEAAALTWADVDFEGDSIRIRGAKESGSSAIKGPKTKAGVRVLPHIPAAIRPGLEAAARGKTAKDFVFPGPDGRVMSDTVTRLRWKAIVRAMDIHMGATVFRNQITQSKIEPGLVLYSLRHAFATDCAAAGVPIDTVRWLMGHEDIQTTANVYQDSSPAPLRAGLLLLDADSDSVLAGDMVENLAESADK